MIGAFEVFVIDRKLMVVCRVSIVVLYCLLINYKIGTQPLKVIYHQVIICVIVSFASLANYQIPIAHARLHSSTIVWT